MDLEIVVVLAHASRIYPKEYSMAVFRLFTAKHITL